MNSNTLATEILSDLKKKRNAWRLAALSLIGINLLTVIMILMRCNL